ncbi:choline-sulfatase [Salipiger sp. IMCC34102]|uniref:sulfatase-like hydrolase/transferase n=1 Tax=Salipiger sp. IMCC34102 TaxID=2510647 RepID=UPI00101D12A2|nr:sulfatase-like hydrolase/transferase [Salipiger sp. IMCC34102]RYH02518.1 choline-sulfatase [Salipiger sp. IMCC34102]
MSRTLPNILCLVSEDCPPWSGPYGDPLARTPHLDRLAAEGVTYEAACCTSPVCAPSRFAILTGRHAESAPPAQQMTGFGPTPPGIHTTPQVLRDAGYYCTNSEKTHYNCDLDPETLWDETSATAHWRNRPEGAPFYAIFNTMVTHESCVFEPKPGPVGPGDVTVPPYLPDTQGIRQAKASYYNEMERMDAFMGARLAELEEDGLSDDTIVLYYSDHGSPLPRSKRFCYDEGLRVPLIVRVPPKWRHLLPLDPGSRQAGPVSLVDLFPSLAAVAGGAAPEGLHGVPFLGPDRRGRDFAFSGRDRMDEHYDMTRTLRGPRFRYIRNYAPHRIWGQHYAFAWLGQAYQDAERAHLEGRLDPVQDRFWQRKPAEELYDMAEDPDAIHNLADDPAHADTLRKMRAALDAQMVAIHDCGFIPEGSAAQDWTPSRDAKVYPLTEVMALAARAIRRDPAEAEGFMAALDHASPVMRFWAAQGLLMLAVEGHALPRGLADRMAREADPCVRVPLAEALGHAGDAPAQVTYLTKLAGGEGHPRLRLQALDALHWLPLMPEVSLPVVAGLAEDTDEYLRGSAGYLKLRLEGTYDPSSTVFRFDLFKPTGHAGTKGPADSDAATG